MKCQHCGINFDDGERECPICGARAGSRGRLSAPRRFGGSAKPTYQTFTEDRTYRSGAGKAHSKVKTIKHTTRQTAKNGKQGNKGVAGAVIAIVVVLFNVLPMLGSLLSELVYDLTDSIGSSYIAEPMPEAEPAVPVPDLYYVPGETYGYDDYGGEAIYARLADLTGTHAVAELADGRTLELAVEPGEMGDYTLTIHGDWGEYVESGHSWCIYNYPEEGMYDDAYPPPQYDSFELYLTLYEQSMDSDLSYLPGPYAERQQIGDLWLRLYFDPATGETVLEDTGGSDFFGEPFVHLAPIASA
ncbi:MAG: hypothetical protein Q4D31_02465 [Eubacteriales bacterium]|nr:hypothetical protein [Eubacteriales bacterium]